MPRCQITRRSRIHYGFAEKAPARLASKMNWRYKRKAPGNLCGSGASNAGWCGNYPRAVLGNIAKPSEKSISFQPGSATGAGCYVETCNVREITAPVAQMDRAPLRAEVAGSSPAKWKLCLSCARRMGWADGVPPALTARFHIAALAKSGLCPTLYLRAPEGRRVVWMGSTERPNVARDQHQWIP